MREKKFYIAYGSNLSVNQMSARCPEARIVGKSILKDWKLVFKYHADIEPCEGETVQVLIWEISENDEQRLDLYEGYPFYYIKKDLNITVTDLSGNDPREITAMVYVMNKGHKIQPPARSYYDVLKEGYGRFGFDEEPLKNALNEARQAQKADNGGTEWNL